MSVSVTDVRSDLRGGAHVFGTFFSLSHVINLAPSVSESSPKGNDFELADKISSQKSGVSRLRVLIG